MHPNQVTIIMVEDDPGHALLIEKNLRRAGIMNAITRFTSGKQVLDYLLDDNALCDTYDQALILLDLNLPEIDGFEVLERLKGDNRTKRIPVIVLTTTSTPQEIDRCYELGCNIYITKPVDYTSFSEALTKLGLMLAVVKVPHPMEE